MYGVIVDIFLKTIVFKVTKILDPKHHNPIWCNWNNQEIQISAKHALQNAITMTTSDPITKILPHHQVPR